MRRRFISVLAIVLAAGALGLQPVAAVERAQPCPKEGATASTPAKRSLICVRRLDGPLLWQFVPPPSKQAKITTYGTIPTAKLDRFRRGLAAAEAYLGADAGPVTWHVFDKVNDDVLRAYAVAFGAPTDNLEPLRPALEHSSAIGGNGAVFVRSPAMVDDPGRSVDVTMIHEYEHTRQLALDGHLPFPGENEVPLAGPRWLIEGTAELAGYRGADAYGYVSWSVAAGLALRGAAAETQTPLARMRTQAEVAAISFRSNRFYNTSFAAAVLLSSYSSDKAVLTTYWQKLGTGLPWEDAFTAAFGITSTDFYAKHLKWQQAKFALNKIPPRR